MRRRVSTLPCKVYRYGLRPPVDEREGQIVAEQIWLAHRYYNDLIEVEHACRQAYVWARDAGAEMKAVNKRLNEERKDVCNARVRDPEWGPGLRGTCGLYSGTYLLVEASAEQAGRKKGAPPKFRRWTGNGAIGVQINSPLPVSEMVSAGHRLGTIDMSPRYRKTRRHPKGVQIKNGVTLTIPVAPGGVRVSFPMTMHRPLPPDGKVTWIKIIRRREGTRERWEAHITVDAASFVRPEREGLAAAIDLCWSRGRVGHVLGEDGYEDPVMPHPEILKKLRYADSVRSIRDGYINVAKEWAALNIDAHVRSWHRMHARGLLRKIRQWRGDGHDVTTLDAWAHRDRHLYQIETGVRSKAKRRLVNDYRVWARILVDNYPVIILEDLALNELAKKKAGAPTRVAYAPSHVRDALVNAGARIVKVPAERTSADCHKCGEPIRYPTYHHPVCDLCGWTGDRRENAVRNILARGLAALGRQAPLAPAGTVGNSASQPTTPDMSD